MSDTAANGWVLTQIAMVGALDHVETADWYRRVLGFVGAGSTTFAGAHIAEIQGLGADVSNADLDLAWAVDRNDFFQLEFFKYREPESRSAPERRRPCDIGYSVVSMYVKDFDAAVDRLAAADTVPIAAPQGSNGQRRVCVEDPNGIVLELMEADIRTPVSQPPARPGTEVAVRGLRASVPDLTRARRFFVDILGMKPVEIEVHGPEHEALWCLPGAECETLTLTAGDRFLELAQYRDPLPRPWPAGYRLSDHGVMNFALGARSPEPYRRARARVIDNGYTAHRELVVPPEVEVTYVLSEDGFSVELMFMGTGADRDFGFVPR